MLTQFTVVLVVFEVLLSEYFPVQQQTRSTFRGLWLDMNLHTVNREASASTHIHTLTLSYERMFCEHP